VGRSSNRCSICLIGRRFAASKKHFDERSIQAHPRPTLHPFCRAAKFGPGFFEPVRRYRNDCVSSRSRNLPLIFLFFLSPFVRTLFLLGELGQCTMRGTFFPSDDSLCLVAPVHKMILAPARLFFSNSRTTAPSYYVGCPV